MPASESSLRARLVEVGVAMVATEGTDALSLREIARRAGVSHGAPRRYFPTHQALLASIALEGYRQLGARVAELLGRDEPEPRRQLRALAGLYLDFARTNPGMFELMFRHDLLRGNQVGLRAASRPLFGVLVELVAKSRPADVQPVVVAGALWANLHGLAQLWRWESLQSTVEVDQIEPLLDTVIDAYLPPW